MIEILNKHRHETADLLLKPEQMHILQQQFFQLMYEQPQKQISLFQGKIWPEIYSKKTTSSTQLRSQNLWVPL